MDQSARPLGSDDAKRYRGLAVGCERHIVACVCRRLHRAIFAPDHDRVLWRPLTLTMAADGVRPRRGTGCTWREVFLRLIGIEAVSRKCRLLEVSAARLHRFLGCVSPVRSCVSSHGP